MKAKELLNILNMCPEADVRMENISYPTDNGCASYDLKQINGYRVDKNYKGEITTIILSNFNIQPSESLF